MHRCLNRDHRSCDKPSKAKVFFILYPSRAVKLKFNNAQVLWIAKISFPEIMSGVGKGGAEGDRGWDDLSPLTRCLTNAPKDSKNHTILAYFGGWAAGRGVYTPRNR